MLIYVFALFVHYHNSALTLLLFCFSRDVTVFSIKCVVAEVSKRALPELNSL